MKIGTVRPSNWVLDDFEEEYLERCSSAIYPACGHKVKIGKLVVDRDGTFVLPEN